MKSGLGATNERTYVINKSDTAPFTTPAKVMEMSNKIDADEFSDEDKAGVLALVVSGEVVPEIVGDCVEITITRSGQ
jgi:hypothetical protein